MSERAFINQGVKNSCVRGNDPKH